MNWASPSHLDVTYNPRAATLFFQVVKTSGLDISTSSTPMAYELYSWPDPNGGLNFRLLVSPSGVNVSAQEVFDDKFVLQGLSPLEQQISKLPACATIFWPGRLSSGTGENAPESAKLHYPPPQTIQDIRASAQARQIKVELFSDQQKPNQ